MSNIIWTDCLNTGIDAIDEQHRHIVELFNNMANAHGRGDFLVANELFYELIGFKLSHCAYEEDLLKRSGFPLCRAHKQSHEHLVNQCLVLHQRADKGEYIAKEAIALLKEILLKHMHGEDADYANYMRRAQRSERQERLGVFNFLKRVFR